MLTPVNLWIKRISYGFACRGVFAGEQFRKALVAQLEQEKQTLVMPGFAKLAVCVSIWIVQERMKSACVSTQRGVKRTAPRPIVQRERRSKQRFVEHAPVVAL